MYILSSFAENVNLYSAPPRKALKRGFSGVKCRRAELNFGLAGMEGMRCKYGSMQLDVGNKIFRYTDGVTEAANKDNELFGNIANYAYDCEIGSAEHTKC